MNKIKEIIRRLRRDEKPDTLAELEKLDEITKRLIEQNAAMLKAAGY